tara:strand:+ start:122 stop:1123 length:1002 start_codon:yes stop_codon:yes gene_type:complete
MNDKKLIQIQNLSVNFPIKKGVFSKPINLKAVDNISFNIMRGETLGLVGESGSGKTTIGRAILNALNETQGEIIYKTKNEEIDLSSLKGKALRKFRRRMQLIFQDPYTSLSPRMTVRDIIAEPIEASGLSQGVEHTNQKVRDIATLCRLNIEHLRRYPHAFSGGQRQRISIARSLVTNPEFVVCDESVAALDVSIQADVLNLLKNLQNELQLTYLFISHDLSVVSYISDRVAVLYLGKIVELSNTRELFEKPMHPYTRALFAAIPQIDVEKDPQAIKGEIPSPLNIPSGCRFNTRCPFAEEKCYSEEPEWRKLNDDHYIACHFAEKVESLPLK